MSSRPKPPRPGLQRKPARGFGWLDAELLHEHWLPSIGADGLAVLAFLALAADREGASYYGRARIAAELNLTIDRLDRALDTLLELRLVAHRPWRDGHRDGVWQILPMQQTPTHPRVGGTRSAAELLRGLGLRDDPENRDP
jgi:hypothetical protein